MSKLMDFVQGLKQNQQVVVSTLMDFVQDLKHNQDRLEGLFRSLDFLDEMDLWAVLGECNHRFVGFENTIDDIHDRLGVDFGRGARF